MANKLTKTIKRIERAFTEALTEEYGKDGIFAEVECANLEFFESDYNHPLDAFEVRLGRYQENGANNFQYTLVIKDVYGKPYKFILGVATYMCSLVENGELKISSE